MNKHSYYRQLKPFQINDRKLQSSSVINQIMLPSGLHIIQSRQKEFGLSEEVSKILGHVLGIELARKAECT